MDFHAEQAASEARERVLFALRSCSLSPMERHRLTQIRDGLTDMLQESERATARAIRAKEASRG